MTTHARTIPPPGRGGRSKADKRRVVELMKQSRAAGEEADDYERQADELAKMIEAVKMEAQQNSNEEGEEGDRDSDDRSSLSYQPRQVELLTPAAVHAHLRPLTRDAHDECLAKIESAAAGLKESFVANDYAGALQQYKAMLEAFPSMQEKKLRIMEHVMRLMPIFDGDVGETAKYAVHGQEARLRRV